MKKLVILAASISLAAITQAASVGWSLATGSTSYAGDAYMFFITGQKGVTGSAAITALLDAGTDVSTYAFGSGVAPANGNVNATAASTGKTIDAGTYSAFFVLFDSASPTAGSTKYALIEGASTLTKTVAATTANVVFASGSQATYLSNASNWQTYGAPEPTSGLLLLLGVAGLALKRKRA